MNKLNIAAYMLLLWAVLSLTGCGKNDPMYLSAKTQEEDTASSGNLDKDFDGTTATAIDDSAADVDDAEKQSCFVYVCGAVENPGVYELPEGSRIYEAIMLAGGLHKDASVKGINQAQRIEDGDMIEILTEDEQKELEESGGSISGQDADTGQAHDGLIDINTASLAQLMTLNGIGESKAANIIAYRESNGKFQSIEEIKNVNGIGEGVYANIQDKITVTR